MSYNGDIAFFFFGLAEGGVLFETSVPNKKKIAPLP